MTTRTTTTRDTYRPAGASGAEVRKDDKRWTLVLVRDLRHPPVKVWRALTDPAQVAQWAPFDTDRSLAEVGPVRLATVGAPAPQVSDNTVNRAEAPRLLEYTWGGQDLRWELEPTDGGTRLTLWHLIERKFIAWGAAGWHICLDVLALFLADAPIGRIVGPEAMKFEWQRLVGEYAGQLGVEAPAWPGAPQAKGDA
jgi:uncharacterized protein YndB with AHSA1/START domain